MSYVRLSDLGVKLLPVGSYVLPIEQQKTFVSCGPAALACVVRQRGGRVSEDQLSSLLGTGAGGTRPSSIARVAKLFGLKSELRQNATLADLGAAIASGVSVILDVQRWEDDAAPAASCEDAHFLVLAGVGGGDIFVADPAEGRLAWMSTADLLDRWHGRPWPGEPCVKRVAVFLSGGRPPTRTDRPQLVEQRFR